MPRNRVKTIYRKASVTPSRRERERVHDDFIPAAKEPIGLSPLAAYLRDNEGTGISTTELIEQFQEYDCDHREKSKIVTGHKEIYTCEGCGMVEVKVKAE